MAEEYYGDSPYTDAEIEELLASGSLTAEEELLLQQRKQANALRGKSGPQGIDSGRIYTAANPLEHLAYGLEQRGAKKELERIDEAQRGVGERTARAGGIIGRALRRKPFRLKPLDYEDELSKIPMPTLPEDLETY